jgi:hypothetical protein
MASCKLVWCPKTGEEAGEFFTSQIGPLLQKHWDTETTRTGIPHGLDVPSFLAAWEQKGILIVMAYDGTTPVGFLIAYKFRPLFFMKTVLNVERWFAEDVTVEDDMFSYLMTVVPVMGVDQVHVVEHEGQAVPVFLETDQKDTYTMTRLVV